MLILFSGICFALSSLACGLCNFLIILLVFSDLGRYASIMAIESPYKEDDQLWLTYWVLYSFVTLLELVAAPVFRW